MAVTARQAAEPRWHRTFRSADTLADDLGSVGAWVGPRTGPDKRTQGQKEDYVLRRLLVAWKQIGLLACPLDITAATDEPGQPDFLITWPKGETLGVEVTEAGEEDYQALLTRTESETAQEAQLMSKDGYAGDGPTRMAANDIRDAIAKKVAGYNQGKYREPDSCDLVVFDNSETGWWSDKQRVLNAVGRPGDLLGRFRQIHLVIDEIVYLDVFGNEFQAVDIGKTYEIDYVNWIFDQVERMRRGATDELDLNYVAEELGDLARSDRRKIGSHLRNLLRHLLKWAFQPGRRGKSWQRSMVNARTEIETLLSDSPSLGAHLLSSLPREYERARKMASLDTSLADEDFPETCPYTIEQILDHDFLPGEES